MKGMYQIVEERQKSGDIHIGLLFWDPMTGNMLVTYDSECPEIAQEEVRKAFSKIGPTKRITL